jgi:hypothetical protein
MMNHQSRVDQIEHPKVIKVIGHDIVLSDLQARMTDLIEPLDVDVSGDDLSEATLGQQEQGSRAAPGADLPAPAAAGDTDAIKPPIRRRIEGTLKLLKPSSRHVDGAGTPDVLVLIHLQPRRTANEDRTLRPALPTIVVSSQMLCQSRAEQHHRGAPNAR